MNEQEFQLELERFKQKERWETHIFYFVLSALWGIILLGITQNISEGIRNQIWGLSIRSWFLILAGVLIFGEWVLQGGWHMIGFLNLQKEIFRRKILGKDAKILDENKIKDLIVLEMELKDKISKKNRKDKEIIILNQKIEKLEKEIWEEKDE